MYCVTVVPIPLLCIRALHKVQIDLADAAISRSSAENRR